MQASINEVLNISFAYGVLGSLDTALLNTFSRLYPDIQINYNDEADLAVEEDLLSGRAEIGFAVEPVDREKFDVWPVHSEPIYLIVHKDNPLYTKKIITAEDLRGKKFTNPGSQMKYSSAINEFCKRLVSRLISCILLTSSW